MVQKFLSLIVSLLLIWSCQKDQNVPNNIPSKYDQYGTPFTKMPNMDQAVMYEINLRAFSQGGDIQGITDRLSDLKALGVNIIWLMPIFEQGIERSINSPYSIKNYKTVSSEYGSLEDLRLLTTKAHEMGMAVILDWVANHTSWDHDWITEHSDWYSKDAQGNIIIPPGTNWSDVADLNFSVDAMKKEMYDALSYWVLEANIDGYRCDHADGVPYSFWQETIMELNKIPNRNLFFLAEGSRKDHFTAGFHLIYDWNFYTAAKNVWNSSSSNLLYNTHLSEYTNIPVGKCKLRFTTNHDESAWDASPITLFKGKSGALAASVATIFSGAVPLMYSGQEVGRAGTTPFFSKSPILWSANEDMLTTYRSLFALRASSSVLRKGVLINHVVNNDVLVWEKTLDNESALILINVRNKNIEVNLQPNLTGSYKNALTNLDEMIELSFNLKPYEFRILVRN
ncbi:MAG: alpha-amylase family glycosyl hydrolase [Saprospiraceae bacterium]